MPGVIGRQEKILAVHKILLCLHVQRQSDVHGLLFHSARTGWQSSGVISQSTKRRLGLRCYFIVHEHEVGVRCYLIVHEPEGKGQVLFHSARTAGQGSEKNVQCTMFPMGSHYEFFVPWEPDFKFNVHFKHFVSTKRFIRL